jgi:hypothetical protein
MLTTPIGIFPKFEIQVHAGISSNTLSAIFQETLATVADATAVRPRRPSCTRGHPLAPRCRSPSAPARTPAREGEKVSFLPLSPGSTVTEPTDRCRRHHAVPGRVREHRSPFPYAHALATLAEAAAHGKFPAGPPPLDASRSPSPAYKRPPFLSGKMNTTSLSLLDIVSR